ncbi:hypothetical protein [Cupriavidus sp. Marseille-Q8015]
MKQRGAMFCLTALIIAGATTARPAFALATPPTSLARVVGADESVPPGVDRMGPPPTGATEVVFRDADRRSMLMLPDTANDRDRIAVRSETRRQSTIHHGNVDIRGTLNLSYGDRYEFIYRKDSARWIMVRHPEVVLAAAALPDGKIPAVRAPTTRIDVTAGDGDSRPIVLPDEANPGDQILVNGAHDARTVVVTAAQSGRNSWKVRPGDRVRFTYTSGSGWSQGNMVVRMLLVYGDQAAARMGASAMQARMAHAVRMTNQALADSRVHLWINPVGFLQHEVQGPVPVLLSNMVGDRRVQAERLRLHAHAAYYEGVLNDPNTCGRAYVGVLGRHWWYALGMTVVSCASGVMEHEFGHIAGIHHADGPPSPRQPPYARGYLPASTILAFRYLSTTVPYYSNADLADPITGAPLGSKSTGDAAREMNDVAELMQKDPEIPD